MTRWILLSLFMLVPSCSQVLLAQGSINTLAGTVTLRESGSPVENASITIVELRKVVQTDAKGMYRFTGVPSGKYNILIHLDRVADLARTVDVANGDNRADFEMQISGINEQVTVTAAGSPEATDAAYQSVSTVGAVKLATRNSLSIGEALENEPGVAKRSFGPGSGRPVIRGFDGDRVLVLVDGQRPGGIASQSGDEVEPVDVLSLDRVEIVRGPATLLYGSNAIGGVVNGISTNDVYQRGFSGYATAFGGTNDKQAGVGGGFKYGYKKLMFFGGAGTQRSSDYNTPHGRVRNSFVRNQDGNGGLGWFSQKGWLAFDYASDRRRHGIPVEPDEVDLESLHEQRSNYRVRGGFRKSGGPISGGDFALSYNRYRAREFEFETDEGLTELESVATNRNLNYRANFDQKRVGRWSGIFGVSGFTRDYESTGAEAPAPRTKQKSFASYALERFDLERVGFQFGARIEQNGYRPVGNFPSRNFVGFSGGAGIRVALWSGGSFIANYQHSFRAPALEELYNNGPHPGIQVFDIGNPDLKAEQGDGIDLSVRHASNRLRFDTSLFYYHLNNFVYTRYTGSTDPGSNLPIIRYDQAKSRFAGVESSIQALVAEGLWLEAKFDLVHAELIQQNKPLPRIPPVRGTLALNWTYKGLGVRPEMVMAARQTRVFDNESPTACYAVINLTASYTMFAKGTAHILAFSGYNLTDKLYTNNLSFLKELAPERGRGARFTYTVRF